MSATTTTSSQETLTTLKRQVASAVEADGPEAHQIDIDRLVWSHARVEVARALREWAESSKHPLTGDLAEVAELQAFSALSQLTGEGFLDAVQISRRLADIAERLEPLQDVGASEAHRLLRSSLREFADREVKPYASRMHRQDEDIPEHIIRSMAGLGLFGVSIPAEYGGAQVTPDVKAMLIATEELSRASLAGAGSLITRPEILVQALLRGGTEKQKRQWLPAIANGDKMVAVAVTEPDCGSDVASLSCPAKELPDGDWEITGTKLWCSFAGRSELVMLLCRTGQAGHRGLSAFVIEKPAFAGHEFEYRQPGGGTLIGKAIPTIGYRGMHTFALSFDHFRTLASSLIGEGEGLNRGFYLQMEGFAMGRIQTAGRAVGVMQAAFEDTLAYTKDRVVFGQPIFANELARSKVGMMALWLQGSRQLSYLAARMLDEGNGQTEASLAKLYASRVAESLTREATQLHGAMGYSEEADVSRYFVDARVLGIFEGAEEVLSLRVIGRALLQEMD